MQNLALHLQYISKHNTQFKTSRKRNQVWAMCISLKILGDQNRENFVQMWYKNIFPYEITFCLRLSPELHVPHFYCCSKIPEQQKKKHKYSPPPHLLRQLYPSRLCLDHHQLCWSWEETDRVVTYVCNSWCRRVGKIRAPEHKAQEITPKTQREWKSSAQENDALQSAKSDSNSSELPKHIRCLWPGCLKMGRNLIKESYCFLGKMPRSLWCLDFMPLPESRTQP